MPKLILYVGPDGHHTYERFDVVSILDDGVADEDVGMGVTLPMFAIVDCNANINALTHLTDILESKFTVKPTMEKERAYSLDSLPPKHLAALTDTGRQTISLGSIVAAQRIKVV